VAEKNELVLTVSRTDDDLPAHNKGTVYRVNYTQIENSAFHFKDIKGREYAIHSSPPPSISYNERATTIALARVFESPRHDFSSG
jgi:hypothetical protein